MRFSQMVVEQRRIKEVDINPLLASPKAVMALDARIVLYGRDVADQGLAAFSDHAVSVAIRFALEDDTGHGNHLPADSAGR